MKIIVLTVVGMFLSACVPPGEAELEQVSSSSETPGSVTGSPTTEASSEDVGTAASASTDCYSDCFKIFGLAVYCSEKCHTSDNGCW